MANGSAIDAPQTSARTAIEDTSIRPFRVHVSNEALADLRRRIQATRWPDKETVADRSQGAPLAELTVELTGLNVPRVAPHSTAIDVVPIPFVLREIVICWLSCANTRLY